MARKIQVLLIDDLDGSSAQETVTFGLDGTSYEIDLSAENIDKLRKAFAPWVGNGRKIGRGTARRSASTQSSGSDANVVREWALRNGLAVNARGRIPLEVRNAYEAAN